MKSPEIIDRLIRGVIVKMVIIQWDSPTSKPLPEGWEKLIKGRG